MPAQDDARREFTYTSLPVRVVFGAGALEHLAREVAQLGAKRALVLCTAGQRDRAASTAAEQLGSKCVGTFDGAVMHVPIESAERGRAEAVRLEADCLVAIGGGSTVGLAKAIAL